MTREEAKIKIGELGMYARTQEWDDQYTEAVNMAIKALEQKLVNISCKNCKNFNPKDNYCSLLQINWLPDDFGCVKKEGV